ncbi:ATP phosphoribosyltransferase regulatory subunit, partial [Patescibacteria group bacterium]|nr:ATP phosphoribosyltransferase regulatory subunit [Patescibacteria group bacterium]
AITAVKKFLDIEKGSRIETLAEARQLLAGSKDAAQGMDELAELGRALGALGVPDKNWTIDFSVARGLGYYTGPIFETILPEAPQFGSVMSGGRYDGLIGRFGGNNVPATGVSVGLDRLFAAMKELRMARDGAGASVIVLNFDPAATEACLGLLSDIRDVGIPAEIYLGTEKTLKGQLAYAVKKDYAVLVILGGTEMQKGIAEVKDLKRRDQKPVPLSGVPAFVQTLLGK